MAEYATCECYACHVRVLKPNARRISIEVEKGANKEVWLCAFCSAAHAKSQQSQGLATLVVLGVFILIGGAVVFWGRGHPPKETPSIEPTHTALAYSPNPTANVVRPVEPAKDSVPPSKDIAQVQRRLIELGYLGGSADGVWGSKSRAALRTFKSAHGLRPDEHWDDTVGRRLFSKNAVRASLPIAKAQ
jgi:Putative peptidoglycan binding domain